MESKGGSTFSVVEKVVFILGPTGVGKSKMAVKLAHQFGGEIISADSVQLFQGFDIGSAKVTLEEMDGIPHYCIDVCQPEMYFSVFDFVAMTRQKITEISAKGKLPIVVGGTGLYIKALLEGFNFGATNKEDAFRKNLENRIQTEGAEIIWKELNQTAPDLAQKIDWHNHKRLIRGMEIATFGGKQTTRACPYDYLLFALTLPRDVLYERINARVDHMVQDGLVEEVKSLLKKGILKDCQPMQAIGYKEMVSFLDGDITLERAIELIKQHSRNYAKRQMTFLRSMEKVKYIDVSQYAYAEDELMNIVKGWL